MKLVALLLPFALLTLPAVAEAAESHAVTMPGGPTYVRLRPISFSVIGADNRINKEVSILLDLELEQDKTEPQFEPYKRQVMDAFLIALNEAYTEQKPDDPPVGGDELKAKLLKAASDITGPGVIHQVLIMSIGERGHAR